MISSLERSRQRINQLRGEEEPPKVLTTKIFNDSNATSTVSRSKINPGHSSSAQFRSRTPTKTPLKTRKPRERSKKKRLGVDLHKVPNLNLEIEKVVKLFLKHSATCAQMKSELFEQGGSRLVEKYIRSRKLI